MIPPQLMLRYKDFDDLREMSCQILCNTFRSFEWFFAKIRHDGETVVSSNPVFPRLITWDTDTLDTTNVSRAEISRLHRWELIQGQCFLRFPVVARLHHPHCINAVTPCRIGYKNMGHRPH